MSKPTDTKALAQLAIANVKAAGEDSEAAQRAIVQAMTASAQAARAQVNSHTLTDGATNAAVTVGATSLTRVVQNLAADLGGKRGRAIANRVLGVFGLFGVMAFRGGTKGERAATPALVLATAEGTDGVYNGLKSAFVGGVNNPESEVMVGEVVSREVPTH